MKTPNPPSFADRKSRSRFSTVLFSLTLSPTSPQDTPFSLRTSFWGSMTTRAVSCLPNSIAMLLESTPGLLLRRVLAEELAHQPGDLAAVRLQGKMPGVEEVVLE